MTSRPKGAAHVRTARVSTGPRSTAGKARASQNARRHGLSISVLAYPEYSVEVTTLARTIAGDSESSDIQEHARRIAEAQIDLMRIRQARHDMLVRHLDGPKPVGRRRDKSLRARSAGALESSGDLIRNLPTLAKKLSGLERYERRALSRRKRAIHAFDAACRQKILAERTRNP